jgi:hypothetical protein
MITKKTTKPKRIGKSNYFRDKDGERFSYVSVYGKKRKRRNYTN